MRKEKLLDTLRPLDRHTKTHLNQYITNIEDILKSDVLTIFGPIIYGLENVVSNAIELFQEPKDKITIILDTIGGIVEVVERMVSVIRYHYTEVDFVIPDRAMSAGTVFAMSGDSIYMSYFSCLGPIDPQIEKDEKLVPALSYLNQYERLVKKANTGELNTADITLLNKLDLGELYQFEQAHELSKELLIKWLSTYKFKDLTTKDGKPASDKAKNSKAKQIAETLSDHKHWHSHARMIPRETLISSEKLGIDINRIEDIPNLSLALKEYIDLLKDYMSRETYRVFVHTKHYF